MKKGFTLIELLAAVAVVSILAIVTVLTINPSELLRQARDANRASDVNTLNKAVSLYYSDAMNNPSTMFMGTSSVIYISIPDTTGATSTAGDQCQGLNLPAAPTGYTYQCAASSTYTKVDGTGWLPINLKSYVAGAVISELPVDPINTTSTNYYYTYQTDGIGGYEITGIFESQKYKTQYAQNPSVQSYPEIYAKGSNLALSGLYNSNGLVGYWPLDEGSGNSAQDASGNGSTGRWSGTASGANSTYYSTGKVGNYAGVFDGTTDYVWTTATFTMNGAVTMSAWAQPGTSTEPLYRIAEMNYANTGEIGGNSAGTTYGWDYNNHQITGGTIASGTWVMVTGVYDGTNQILYLNGAQVGSPYVSGSATGTNIMSIGATSNNHSYKWNGLIDDVRIYNRALSPAEIKALYNAEK